MSISSSISVRFSGFASPRRFFATSFKSFDLKSLVRTSSINLWFISSIILLIALVSSPASYNVYRCRNCPPSSQCTSECCIFLLIAVSMYRLVDSSLRNADSSESKSPSSKSISPARSVPPYRIYSSISSFLRSLEYSRNGINVVWILYALS